jgi:hypothetical protein
VCTGLPAAGGGGGGAAYLERHPVAAAHLGERDRLYALAITWAKLTDNRIGFGKRLVWTVEPPWRRENPAGPGEETALP